MLEFFLICLIVVVFFAIMYERKKTTPPFLASGMVSVEEVDLFMSMTKDSFRQIYGREMTRRDAVGLILFHREQQKQPPNSPTSQ